LIDLTFLDSVLASIPGWSTMPEPVRGIIYVGIIVQAILGFSRLAITGSKTKETVLDHWFTRFMSRFGPIANVLLGGVLAAVSTVPLSVGLVGGGFSSYTYALVHKVAKPAFEKTVTHFGPK
jgi:hypothetical protein